jgi:hypothetical protein
MCVYIYIYIYMKFSPKHVLMNNKSQPREILEMQYPGACKGLLGLQSCITDSTFERHRKKCTIVANEVIRQAIYISCNILVHSHNHRCSENAIMYFVCVCVCVRVCARTLLATCHCKLHKNIKCFMTRLLWKIYETSNNRMYKGLHVKCQMVHYNKIVFVCSQPFLNIQFG